MLNDYKLYYKSLTNLDAKTKSIYNRYLLIKMKCDGETAKHGFLAKKEVDRIAFINGQSKRSLVNQLASLVDNNFIKKNKWGYVLTSSRTINNSLNFSYVTKDGNEHTPFLKVQLPASEKVIELTRLYYLIQQVYTQYQYRLNVCKSDDRKVKRPEKFLLSIDKICERGNYSNKMYVWRLINQLENVGLLSVIRGKKRIDNFGKNDCSQYTLYPFSQANWNLIDVQKRPLTCRQQLATIIADQPIKRKRKAVKKDKKKTIYNIAEQLFYKCLDSGLQDIMVSQGYLSKSYESFGKMKGRKVSKPMLSELIIQTLNNTELRTILFKVLSPENFNVIETNGYYYDTRLHTKVMDRYTFFDCHKIELVNDGGNFNQYGDELLVSYKTKSIEIKNKIYGKVSL